MYEYKATVVRVVDGDTVRLRIDLGCWISIEETCRLSRINTPEIRGAERPEGLKAKEALIGLLKTTPDLVVRTVRDKSGKYGRLLVDLYDGSFCVNDMLVSMGHAEYVK